MGQRPATTAIRFLCPLDCWRVSGWVGGARGPIDDSRWWNNSLPGAISHRNIARGQQRFGTKSRCDDVEAWSRESRGEGLTGTPCREAETAARQHASWSADSPVLLATPLPAPAPPLAATGCAPPSPIQVARSTIGPLRSVAIISDLHDARCGPSQLLPYTPKT